MLISTRVSYHLHFEKSRSWLYSVEMNVGPFNPTVGSDGVWIILLGDIFE